MTGHLRQLWQSRAPRERTIILALAAIVVAMLYVTLVVSAGRIRPQLRASVLALRADAIRLEQHASEVERLRTVRAPAASQTDLRTLIQDLAGSAGLAEGLVRIEAQDVNRVQAVFGAVPFPDWLNWLVALNAQNIRLETCRIEALSKPGLVSVTATFVRAGQQ
jgi:general secretion pathway protein M